MLQRFRRGAAVIAGMAVLGAGALGAGALGVVAVAPGAGAAALSSPAGSASAPPGSALIPGVIAVPSVSRSAAGAASPSAGATPADDIGGDRMAGKGVVVDYGSSSAPRLPGIKASAFVVANASTGQVLAARDPHGYYRPASTLKVLTAVSLIPLLNPDSSTVATRLAASTVPNVAGLIPGQSYQISSLFTALLTISANDAAIALTQAAGGGSFSQGMALINAEARRLQADDTVAVGPNGLDAPGQHTSAYDLALFARQALTLPAFLKYDETISAKFRVSAKKTETLYNQNSLLTNYPGAIGGKIGWTSAAGATYIGLARRDGVTLIVTLLHCPALTEVDSAETLLNWGFSANSKVTPVGTLVSPLSSAAPSVKPTAKATPTATPVIGRPVAKAAGSHDVASGPSVLAAGFSCVALIAAAIGFVYSRRQRTTARRRRPGGAGGRDSGAGYEPQPPDRPVPGRPGADGRPPRSQLGSRPHGRSQPPAPGAARDAAAQDAAAQDATSRGATSRGRGSAGGAPA